MTWDSWCGVRRVCAVSILVLACGESSATKAEGSAGKAGAGAGSSGDNAGLSQGGSSGTEGGRSTGNGGDSGVDPSGGSTENGSAGNDTNHGLAGEGGAPPVSTDEGGANQGLAGEGGAEQSTETPVATCTFEKWATVFGFAPIHIDFGHLNSDASVDLLGTPSGCCATMPEDIHDVRLFVAGDAEFEELPVVTVPEGALDTGSIDLDGDGLSDLAVLGEGVLRLFLNQGYGFEPAGEHSVEAARVQVYDATGDSIPDLVLSYSEAFVIPGGSEHGTVNEPLTMPLSELPRIGPDLDEDGQPDSVGFANGTLAVGLSDQHGTQPAEYPSSLTPPSSLGYGEPLATTGDFDGDGHRDVLYSYGRVHRSQVSEAAIRLGRGDGSFGPESLVSFPSNQLIDLAAADLTGDGGDDLVAVGRVASDYPVVEVFSSACTPAGD